MAHGEHGATLDARRTVAENPIAVGAQFLDDASDTFFRERVLVLGLRRGQEPKIVQPLVADQGLRKLCDALHHVDEIEDDPPLGAHHQVEVAQANVEVDDDHPLPGLRQRRSYRGGGSGLADPAFA